MPSFNALDALETILPGLFRQYVSSGQSSLSAFLKIAPINTFKTPNGKYQVADTRKGYNAQTGNVGRVSQGAGRGIATASYSEVAVATERYVTDWWYVDDRVREALSAGNPDLDAFIEAIEHAEEAMLGFQFVSLHTAVDSLTAHSDAIDLTDATFDLVDYLRQLSSEQALRTSPRTRPNVLAFGDTAYRKFLNLNCVREAGRNLGTAYPTKGVADDGGYFSGTGGQAPMSSALRAVCAEAGVEPVLIDVSYTKTDGTQDWIFTDKAALVHAAPGRRNSCFQTFSPYEELSKANTGRLAPPFQPGDAYQIEAEFDIATTDGNLGREIDLTLS